MRSEDMSNVGPTRPEPPAGVIYDLAQARTRKAARAAGDDATGITPEGRELAQANAVVTSTDDVRAARVQALKHQVESGEYQPDPEAIARRLLDAQGGDIND